MNSGTPAPSSLPLSWDIFCAVVDNYGDIGVCWRLARQLVAEHGFAVRLWVDDLASFQRICPELDPRQEQQIAAGVTIRRWTSPLPEVEAAQVVVEAFACELPESYLMAMARRPRPPVWINLEYLTAESWAADCHGMASPHPRLPLIKYFFFPGFTPRTGGLLREAGLIRRREAFVATAQTELWQKVGTRPRPGEQTVSLFCYGHLPVTGLLDALAKGPSNTLCLLPVGPAMPEIAAWSGGRLTQAGDWLQMGFLRVVVMDFLPQDDYDTLLFACDLNFVRGEDSFVRAQWAARPLVWQIYPQEEDAHGAKLEAFIAAYSQGLAPRPAAALQAFWLAWNGLGNASPGEVWPRFHAALPDLAEHAARWCQQQAALPDLADSLANFCRHRL